MRKPIALFFAFALFLGGVAATAAGPEVTLAGKLACAHCTLKIEGVTSCQEVLVTEKDGQRHDYWLAKNEVAKQFGHTCAGEKKVTVTGELSEKDGKSWIAASKIEPAA